MSRSGTQSRGPRTRHRLIAPMPGSAPDRARSGRNARRKIYRFSRFLIGCSQVRNDSGRVDSIIPHAAATGTAQKFQSFAGEALTIFDFGERSWGGASPGRFGTSLSTPLHDSRRSAQGYPSQTGNGQYPIIFLVTPDSLARAVQEFLSASRDAVVMEDGGITFDLATAGCARSARASRH